MHLFVADSAFALVTAVVIALSAAAFTLQYAVSDVFNLSAGAFMTLGAYTVQAGTRYLGLSIWTASILALICTGLLSVIMNHFVLAPLSRRGTGPYSLMIVTFAIGIIIQNGLIATFGPSAFTLHYGGSGRAVHVGSFTLTTAQVVTIAIGLFAILVLETALHRSVAGRAIRAVVDSRTLARACGVHTSVITDMAWFVSGCFVALAGMALALSVNTVNATLGENYLLYFIPACLLGGMGRVAGAALGAVVIAFASAWATIAIGAQYQDVVALSILLVVIFLRPAGILGSVRAEAVT